MINSLRLRSPAFASPALSTREERADKKGEESEGYVTYREQTEGWSLKINMVDPRQNLFGRVSQFCETDTVQSIVEQKHLVSATERELKQRSQERRRSDLVIFLILMASCLLLIVLILCTVWVIASAFASSKCSLFFFSMCSERL
jgi:hypothetical protein